MKATRTKKEGSGARGKQELTNQHQSDTEDHRKGGVEVYMDQEQMHTMQRQQDGDEE
jgi:hypothetical protein